MTDVSLTSLISSLGNIPHSRQPDVLATHTKDASFHASHAPDLVIWPEKAADVAQVLRLASVQRIPVTAWGAGTSLEGNPIPVAGGIVLDMRRMKAVVKVETENMTVTVQPGIIGDELNQHLKPYGICFPAQPGSGHIATIGGMIANNAGGMQAVRYGVVGDWVLQLEVVLATGEIITTGSTSFKSVAGYDLKRLFIGSEGTLGIITQAVLKVTSLPQHKATYLVSFPEVESAAHAIQDIIHKGLAPASLELLDSYNIVLLNQFRHLGWDEKPTVIIEFHEKEPLSAQIQKKLAQIISSYQGRIEKQETAETERMKIWTSRWSVRPAIRALFPDLGIIPGDIGIPLSSIPAYLRHVRDISGKYAVKTVTFGHAGDGNFHTWILYTVGDAASLAQAKKVGKGIISFALSHGGTCTAEHGVGIGKRQYLPQEHPTDIAWMKHIKTLFDPQGILNPGKMFL